MKLNRMLIPGLGVRERGELPKTVSNLGIECTVQFKRNEDLYGWHGTINNKIFILLMLDTARFFPNNFWLLLTSANGLVYPWGIQFCFYLGLRWRPRLAQWHVHWSYVSSTSLNTWMGDCLGIQSTVNLCPFVGVDLNVWLTVYIAVIILTRT